MKPRHSTVPLRGVSSLSCPVRLIQKVVLLSACLLMLQMAAAATPAPCASGHVSSEFNLHTTRNTLHLLSAWAVCGATATCVTLHPLFPLLTCAHKLKQPLYTHVLAPHHLSPLNRLQRIEAVLLHLFPPVCLGCVAPSWQLQGWRAPSLALLLLSHAAPRPTPVFLDTPRLQQVLLALMMVGSWLSLLTRPPWTPWCLHAHPLSAGLDLGMEPWKGEHITLHP